MFKYTVPICGNNLNISNSGKKQQQYHLLLYMLSEEFQRVNFHIESS